MVEYNEIQIYNYGNIKITHKDELFEINILVIIN